jgi:hypothetical protein
MIKITDILKQILLEEKAKRDRCLRIADRKFSKPSAYKSGAVVRCRRGKIWKGISEDINERIFYDYQEGRNTVPERLPFDIDKLVNSGAVFVTPAIDGNPNSKTYKEWLEEPGSHLITLWNVIKTSKNGWIRKAITKRASTKDWSNFVDKIYDGKYNQILWSLEKLGIDPMDMLIDNEPKDINEDESLNKWFNRQGAPGKNKGWVDCNTCRDGKCKPCGRAKGEKRAKYPSCRPTPSACKRPGKGKTWGKTK